jgi:ribonuclease HII
MLRAGIDEAGRGPVIGPLVAALVVLDAEGEAALAASGVADSKTLTPERREALASLIEERALARAIVRADPARIDQALRDPTSNLNLLEAQLTAQLLAQLPSADVVVAIDLPTHSAQAYEAAIRSFCSLSDQVSLVLEHKADSNHIACAAASILAKVVRDRLVRDIERSVGVPIGSGYPSDPLTRAFLASHGKSHAHLFRRTWSTYTALFGSEGQRTLI